MVLLATPRHKLQDFVTEADGPQSLNCLKLSRGSFWDRRGVWSRISFCVEDGHQLRGSLPAGARGRDGLITGGAATVRIATGELRPSRKGAHRGPLLLKVSNGWDQEVFENLSFMCCFLYKNIHFPPDSEHGTERKHLVVTRLHGSKV